MVFTPQVQDRNDLARPVSSSRTRCFRAPSNPDFPVRARRFRHHLPASRPASRPPWTFDLAASDPWPPGKPPRSRTPWSLGLPAGPRHPRASHPGLKATTDFRLTGPRCPRQATLASRPPRSFGLPASGPCPHWQATLPQGRHGLSASRPPAPEAAPALSGARVEASAPPELTSRPSLPRSPWT
jgi:hypothetical protein